MNVNSAARSNRNTRHVSFSHSSHAQLTSLFYFEREEKSRRDSAES
uniref:Uncharacterized protein n=1 Tax=Anguilla anguilla TaxID=7936 RepID=A0A0E9Q3R7_ANGAN